MCVWKEILSRTYIAMTVWCRFARVLVSWGYFSTGFFANEQVKHLNPREQIGQWCTQEEMEDLCYGCKHSAPPSLPHWEQWQKSRLGNLSSQHLWPNRQIMPCYVHVGAGFGAEPVQGKLLLRRHGSSCSSLPCRRMYFLYQTFPELPGFSIGLHISCLFHRWHKAHSNSIGNINLCYLKRKKNNIPGAGYPL